MKPEVVAICAFVVSICSLVASCYYIWCTRDHNRRSVRPLPYISTSDFEDRIIVRILNNGTGPLIIKSIIASHKNDSKLRGHIIDLVPSCPPGLYFSNFTKNLSDRALTPGKKLDLIDIEIDFSDPVERKYRDELRALLGNLSVIVHYTDIYDSPFPVYKRNLDWFHRPKMTSKVGSIWEERDLRKRNSLMCRE